MAGRTSCWYPLYGRMPTAFRTLNTILELHAQSTPERPEGWNQHRAAILRVHRDIALSEEVVAIGDRFPAAPRKLRQGLAHTHVEERIHLKERFAIGVQTRYGFAADPLVTGVQLGTQAWQLGGDTCSDGIVHGVAQHVAHRCVYKVGRAKGTRVRVDGSDFQAVGQLFADGETHAPIAGRAAIIGEPVGEIILEIISGGQIVAAAKNRDVPVVVVKSGDLKVPMRAQLAVGSDLFVPAAFEHGAAATPKQSGERVELVESGSQFASNFPLVGLERSGRTGLFGKDQGGVPSIRDTRIQ